MQSGEREKFSRDKQEPCQRCNELHCGLATRHSEESFIRIIMDAGEIFQKKHWLQSGADNSLALGPDIHSFVYAKFVNMDHENCYT